MFSTIKLWIYGIGAAAIAIAVAMFKYRGNKIEELKEDLVVADNNAKVVNETIKSERKVNKFETENKVAAVKAEVKVQVKDVEDVEKTFYSI